MSHGIDQRTTTSSSGAARLRCRAHGEMADWLASSAGSLAITTYTGGKVVLVSSIAGRIHTRARRLPRPMGLAVAGDRLAIAARTRILQFQGTRACTTTQSASPPQQTSDVVFTLQQEFVTGKLNTHDIAFGSHGLYFANTRFNCIARTSPKKKFSRVWQPSFLDGFFAQDRCHLNGVAMNEGRPALATAFCETAHRGGWRAEDRFTQGILIDVRQDRVVARGLCMPHSPRLHRGRWWFCNSGHGTLDAFDPQTGRCEEACALPGFTRGLCFAGDFALVGLSRIRRKHVLDAPPVRRRHAELHAGVALVDTSSGRHVGSLEFVQGGREVFDIAFLAGVRRPNLICLAGR